MVAVAWGLWRGGWHRGSSDLSALDGIGGAWSVFLRTKGSIGLTVVRAADVTEVIKQHLWQNHKNTTKNKVNDDLEKPLQLREKSNGWSTDVLEPPCLGCRIKGFAPGSSCTTAGEQHYSENSRRCCQQNHRIRLQTHPEYYSFSDSLVRQDLKTDSYVRYLDLSPPRRLLLIHTNVNCPEQALILPPICLIYPKSQSAATH